MSELGLRTCLPHWVIRLVPRIRATESLLAERSKDFCNKICQEQTLARLLDHLVGGSE
jgi:hypothetical protein